MPAIKQLDEVESRVIGALMEKQLTTPDTYPLTLNSLLSACNQRSNREPVMELTEDAVSRALDRLQQRSLVWRVIGGRSMRWDHKADKEWSLNPSEKAVVTLLLLRGPQTAGELRGRSDRLYHFDSLDEVQATLTGLATREAPLVSEVPRRAGQKEGRWLWLPGESMLVEDRGAKAAAGESLEERVVRLEGQVERLSQELETLKSKLGE